MTHAMLDGNEAVASVAYRLNEVVAIYPITPASPMGEHADAWAAKGRRNLFGSVPQVVEMQSEGGAAGAVHGALTAGALTTTFTASQGLLLMIPNLYKIAGELTPFCLHVASRTVATHALSIFGDHSDVMAARQTGMAMLCSGSVQEAHDFAAIGQRATLRSRLPLLHFFDGFRTSHEIARVRVLDDETLRSLVDDDDALAAHRARGLTPDRPSIRGTAQNPDVFFQAREAINPFYEAGPSLVQEAMDRFAELTGRRYRLFDYVGAPDAERVLVLMGSGTQTAAAAVRRRVEAGEKVGALLVRLYRPFDAGAFVEALPSTARAVGVLDRTKEPGAPGEPLYLDVAAALRRAEHPATVIGGRYGLSSKEFLPEHVDAVLAELSAGSPRHDFSVGIVDDVTHRSLDVAEPEALEDEGAAAVLWGLGSDGTVGASKSTIAILGETTDLHAQGYFVYDSKKAGAVTVSHLRWSEAPIERPYLVRRAQYVGCHRRSLLDKHDVLGVAADGAHFVLNTRLGADGAFDALPLEVQQAILERGLRFYVIDASTLARQAGLGVRINTIMQACFFALTEVIDPALARQKMGEQIEKRYGKRGAVVVQRNLAVIDAALEHLAPARMPEAPTATHRRPPPVPAEAPDFVQRVTAMMLAGKGDLLPVSAFPVDGTWPVGTSRWEKRSIAAEVPIWDADICIQCNHCALVCPHAAIRAKVYEPDAAEGAPAGFRTARYRAKDHAGMQYTLQVAPDDCTGCTLCVKVCPAKDKSNPRHKAIDMAPKDAHLDVERASFDFFLSLPELDRKRIRRLDVKGSQLCEPLFEFSGACSGCGETPYLKLLTQLFGDRALIANATGCSSIYGANLPTTPYTANADGRGPAWSNSLFEDNAELGLGFRLGVDQQAARARALLAGLHDAVGPELADALLEGGAADEEAIAEQRARVEALRERLATLDRADARALAEAADYLVAKSLWIVGGDGWAYDIGYGGLDHVLSLGRDVNVLVLDTEVYSNTGGQMSKATPLGAAAKFASAGKPVGKKDLGLEAMSYGHVYVASIALGADLKQTVKAFREAEAYPGASLIIAYSPCIAHGYDLAHSLDQTKAAVTSGVWPLYRFDPRRVEAGEPPLVLDAGEPTTRVADYMRFEARFSMVERIDRARFDAFCAQAQAQAERRRALYEQLSRIQALGAPRATE